MNSETESVTADIDTKHDSLANGVDGDHDVEKSDFGKLCSELDLPQDIQRRVSDILDNFRQHKDDLEGVTRSELLMCAMYVAVVDSRMPYGPLDPQLQCGTLGQPSVTITDILVKIGQNVPSLIKVMNTVMNSLNLSDSVKFHLKQFQKKYCIVSALSRPFQKLCRVVFTGEPRISGETMADPLNQEDAIQHRRKLCWTLFVYAKSVLLTEEQIVDAFYILICCMEYILRTTPKFQLNPLFSIAQMNSAEDSSGKQETVLHKLSEEFTLLYDEVESVQRNRVEPLIKKLPHEDGELQLEQVAEQYIKLYRQEGDVNELMFFEQDPHLLPHGQSSDSSPPSGENKGVTHMTPIRCVSDMLEGMSLEHDCVDPTVRAALNTVQQLKNILSSAKDEPSSTLLTFFEKCSAQNPTSDIKSRVESHKKIFVKAYVDITGPNQETVAEQRFTLAQRLYYRVMEAMLQTEKERLSKIDFSKLLNIDAFHKSLLACSVEIVLMTYGVTWDPSNGEMVSNDSRFSFPWILEVFEIQPYNFSKVLESFIKAEPILTKEIIKHLQSLEIKILESLAWKMNSPVFDLLMEESHNSETLATEVTNGTTNGTSATTAEMYLSPMRPQRTRGVSPSTRRSPGKSVQEQGSVSPRPGTIPRTRGVSPSTRKSPSMPVQNQEQSSASPRPGANGVRRSQSLTIFINKVSRLGYNRLQMLCDMLKVQRELQNKIWTCFEYCISHKPALLKNRHLDQVMLCSLYGICKVVDNEIKFKAIVQAYRELPFSEQHIYKSALISGGDYDSIIGFYNKVFMQNMKKYILDSSTNKAGTTSISPAPKSRSSPMNSPVYSLPNRRGFYVSSLKDSPSKPPPSPSQMTPRSRQLYSFGEGLGSAEKLQRINETVSKLKGKIATPKSQKRLRFDQMDDSAANNASVTVPDCITNFKKKKLQLTENSMDECGDK